MRYELRSNVSPSLLCTSYSRTHTIVIHNQGRSQDVRNGGGGEGVWCDNYVYGYTAPMCTGTHIYVPHTYSGCIRGGIAVKRVKRTNIFELEAMHAH